MDTNYKKSSVFYMEVEPIAAIEQKFVNRQNNNRMIHWEQGQQDHE